MTVGILTVKVDVKLSLWSAIKMRIAGVSRINKQITINELIAAKRELEKAK